ncbi:hypothetical protein KC356_g9195, partial [Hortaea werneckii]
MTFETAVPLLNKAARKRRHGTQAGVDRKKERVKTDIDLAFAEHYASATADHDSLLTGNDENLAETAAQLPSEPGPGDRRDRSADDDEVA